MFTDSDVLSKGKHKFIALSRVSPGYLLEVYRNPRGYKALGDEQLKNLLEYIEKNLDKIQARARGDVQAPELEIGFKFAGKSGVLICKQSNKTIFATEKDAKAQLNKIANVEQDNKKPIRTYQCQHCGQWHLTSKPLGVFYYKNP